MENPCARIGGAACIRRILALPMNDEARECSIVLLALSRESGRSSASVLVSTGTGQDAERRYAVHLWSLRPFALVQEGSVSGLIVFFILKKKKKKVTDARVMSASGTLLRSFLQNGCARQI